MATYNKELHDEAIENISYISQRIKKLNQIISMYESSFMHFYKMKQRQDRLLMDQIKQKIPTGQTASKAEPKVEELLNRMSKKEKEELAKKLGAKILEKN